MDKNNEQDFAAYAEAHDNPDAKSEQKRVSQKKEAASVSEAPEAPAAIQNPPMSAAIANDSLKKEAGEKATYNKKVTVHQEKAEYQEGVKETIRNTGMGFVPVEVSQLPTRGMFYPEGTKIFIKAASMNEIKHWSAADETDLSAIDDAINDVIEKCCVMRFGVNDYNRPANWKDLKEIDRFYIVLAIHDFTFPPGKNDLKIVINETDDVVVKKDNIDFVKFDDKLLKYYNAEKLCFSFPVKANCVPGQMLDVYLPCVGVSKWLKDYVQTRTQRREGYDKDFVTYAPLLLEDFRGLNNDTYTGLIEYTQGFTAYEWTLLAKVKTLIEKSITPVLKYQDEAGMEKETQLNFRGGIKAIFQPTLDIDL